VLSLPVLVLQCPRPRPRFPRALVRRWLSRLWRHPRPQWCRRWQSRRVMCRMRVCWAAGREEAPGRGSLAVWVVSSPLRIFLAHPFQFFWYPVCMRLFNAPPFSRTTF